MYWIVFPKNANILNAHEFCALHNGQKLNTFDHLCVEYPFFAAKLGCAKISHALLANQFGTKLISAGYMC